MAKAMQYLTHGYAVDPSHILKSVLEVTITSLLPRLIFLPKEIIPSISHKLIQ